LFQPKTLSVRRGHVEAHESDSKIALEILGNNWLRDHFSWLFGVVKPRKGRFGREQGRADPWGIEHRQDFDWTKNPRFSTLRPLLADSLGID